MSDLHRDIKQLIIDALGLEDISIDDIGDHQTLFGEGLWIYIGPHAKTEVHAALGDAIPGFGLGQGSGADLDGDGGEDFRTAQGDGRCAPMKGRRMAWLGARPFREHDQALAVLQGIAGGVEHVHAAIVADVLGRVQRPSGKGVIPQALLDHAVGVAHQPDQEHHVCLLYTSPSPRDS